MKLKPYIGTSRPVGEYNKRLLDIIESNLNCFNLKKHTKILTVEHYIDNGDQWRVLKDDKVLVCDMSLEQLYYAVAAIISYNT